MRKRMLTRVNAAQKRLDSDWSERQDVVWREGKTRVSNDVDIPSLEVTKVAKIV